VRIDYPRAGRSGARRYLPSWRQLLLLGGLGVGLLVAAFGVAYATIQVPKPNDQALQQASVVYYADGKTVIGRFGDTNRTSIPFAQMPPSLRTAVLAAEDRQFYEHGGFSPSGIVRAAWNDLLGGSMQGGSTITQQLVKNYYLTQDRTISRKVNEFVVSVKIEQQLSKDQILADYLNTIYFGRGAYGVQAAARAYFRTDARSLTPAQGAVLASLIRSPGGYSPEYHLDRLQARWRFVLDGEVQQGWLTETQRAAAVFPTIAPRSVGGLSGPNGYLVAYVEAELARHGISDDDLTRGGLTVVTSIDQRAQAAAVQAVQQQRPTRSATGVHVGLASVNPANGTIVALYGGPDYGHPQFLNDATQGVAQAGSTFKAFTLAAALENGVTLDSTWDGRSGRVFTDVNGARTQPIANEDHKSYGRISLLTAIEQSVNTVFVDVENQPQVGAAKVVDAARRAGIPDQVAIQPTLSATLGVASPTALDMASAYGTFASGGLRTTPTVVVRVVGANGGIRYELQATPTRAFGQDVVAQVDYALQHVVTDGTGTKAREVGRPVAGKTGTTDNNLSAWFVGYTPQLSTSVVLFRTAPDGHTRESLYGVGGSARVNGGSYPAAIWTAYTKAALQGRSVVPFPVPSTLPTATATATPTATPSTTPTPTATGKPTPSPSPTPTPSGSPSPSPTPSPSGSASPAPSPGPTTPATPATPAAPAGAAASTPGILAAGDRRP
jgi:membrane peptidoglycan carboxypeptidase